LIPTTQARSTSEQKDWRAAANPALTDSWIGEGYWFSWRLTRRAADKSTARWSRRRLLRNLPAASSSSSYPRQTPGSIPAEKLSTPFSRFVDVAHSAGLTAIMVYGATGQLHVHRGESMGTGCAFLDYDNDGWMDIFLPADGDLKTHPPTPPAAFTRTTATARSPTSPPRPGWVDSGMVAGLVRRRLQHDGFEDNFVTYYGQNRCIENNGDGLFTDVTAQAGRFIPRRATAPGLHIYWTTSRRLLDLFFSHSKCDLANAQAIIGSAQLQTTRRSPQCAVLRACPSAPFFFTG